MHLENVGVASGPSAGGDQLAAAGLPGAVRVTDGYRGIKLCRKIPGKAKRRDTEEERPHATMLQPFEPCLLPQVFQDLADSFTEQRRPVMTLLAAIKRRPELSQEQCALRTAWDRLEEEVRRIHLD